MVKLIAPSFPYGVLLIEFRGNGEEQVIGEASIESSLWGNFLDPFSSGLSLLPFRVTSEGASEYYG